MGDVDFDDRPPIAGEDDARTFEDWRIEMDRDEARDLTRERES